ncbi:MAG: hypothetical protein ACRDK7_03585 [Solirubrobacteraceae bacterium]
MTRNRRRSSRIVSAVLACVGLGIAALTQAAGVPALAAYGPSAHVAQALNVRDEGHLSPVKHSGSVLLEEGPTSGTLTGTVRARFLYNGGLAVIAQFTLYTAAGTIRAHGLGRLSNPNSSTPSFAGPLAITGGTGRYANAHGRGKLYGVLDQSSDALILQPVGELLY